MCTHAGMNVGIGSEIVVAVAQPCLNVLERVAEVQHDRCTTMSQVVKTNRAQSIFIEDLRKFAGHIVRLDQRAQLINADKIQIARVIAIPAKSSLLLLRIPDHHQIVLRVRAQRERSHAGVGLCCMLAYNGNDTFFMLFADYRCRDAQSPLRKINRAPTQAENFRAPQAIKSSQKNWNSNGLICVQERSEAIS